MKSVMQVNKSFILNSQAVSYNRRNIVTMKQVITLQGFDELHSQISDMKIAKRLFILITEHHMYDKEHTFGYSASKLVSHPVSQACRRLASDSLT